MAEMGDKERVMEGEGERVEGKGEKGENERTDRKSVV